jgi:hypothetical protein
MPKFNINPGHRVVSLQLLMWLQRGVQSREYGIACQDSCHMLAPLQACFAMEGHTVRIMFAIRQNPIHPNGSSVILLQKKIDDKMAEHIAHEPNSKDGEYKTDWFGLWRWVKYFRSDPNARSADREPCCASESMPCYEFY